MKTLLIILVVLSVIALIPVGVDGGYNSKGLSLYLRIGIINIRAIPPGFFVSGVTNRKPKTKKPKPPKAALTEKHKKPKKPNPSREEIFALIKLVLKALSRFRHKLTVDYLRLHFTAASGDPFSTAMSYGTANAALSAAIPLAENAFNIRERDFAAYCDFLADSPSYDLWLTTSIRFWEILYVAAATGIDFLKLQRSRKKAAA